MSITLNSVKADMANYEQFPNWSILEHGIDCAARLKGLITGDTQVHRWALPEWYWQYKDRFKINISFEDALEYATMHDCGKPYCRTIDENGKQHFPNHAEISYQTYCQISDNKIVADLIRHDMDIHLLKADGIEKFCQNPNAILHLLAGLAEINSNAEHCGGFDTTSFKIKFKTLSQRGKAICNLLYKGE